MQAQDLAPPIGIFGGTFDPVHLGHLRPALEVLEALDLAEVRLVPCQIPPHRDMPQLSGDKRLSLLRAASADCPGFSVDTRELDRSGRSYMVDTLASLRAELPTTPLCLILGMDAFLGLPRWHRWEQLVDFAHIVVLDRPGSELPSRGELADWLRPRLLDEPSPLRQRLAGNVYLQSVTQLDISATAIRALLAEGRSVRFLVPDAVWRLLNEDSFSGRP